MKLLTFLIASFTLITSSLCGQNLQNLDRKFGIKNFKLESDFDLYKSQLHFFTKAKDGTMLYYYTGDDSKQMFGVSFWEFGVIFYKNQLYAIGITFNETDKTDENQIYSNLKVLFGEPQIADRKSDEANNYAWGYLWGTEKTFLQFMKFTADPNLNSYRNKAGIYMYSKKIHKEIANDNF